MIYFVGSLRTNGTLFPPRRRSANFFFSSTDHDRSNAIPVIFAAVFFFLEISFWFQIAAYLHLGNGVTGDVINLLKWAGIFGFLTAACGWYLLLVYVLVAPTSIDSHALNSLPSNVTVSFSALLAFRSRFLLETFLILCLASLLLSRRPKLDRKKIKYRASFPINFCHFLFCRASLSFFFSETP